MRTGFGATFRTPAASLVSFFPAIRALKKASNRCGLRLQNGAGYGSRTRLASLGSWSNTDIPTLQAKGIITQPSQKGKQKEHTFCLPFGFFVFCGFLFGSHDPARFKAAVGIVPGQLRDHNAGDGVLRVHEHAVADIDAGVADIA